jgi:hypothetical protein
MIKAVGRVPGAAGKGLDRLAKTPAVGPVVRLFSSVVFGLVILGLIGVYIAIGSGRADLRAALEMTDLEFFNAWPMRILLVLLVLDLTVVTLRRIPLTLFKLGSWTVHTGILTLIAGSVWYFSSKHEGSVRIYLNQTVDYSFDVTERALYAYKTDATGAFDVAHPAITPLPKLPIFYEHLAETGNPLDRPVPGALAPLGAADVAVRITGYYPSAVMQPIGWRAGKPGEAGRGPGLAVQLGNDRAFLPEMWLVGSTPAGRVMEKDLPFGIEYLYHPTAERLRDIKTSFDGPMGLTVRIPSLNIERTYAVKPGESIAVEGSPYTLTPKDLQGMPMASKGYEGTFSTALTVDVARKDPDGTTFNFQRMALFRYPERSPDFVMEDGQSKRKQDGVDAGIQLVFHDASKPELWVVEKEDGDLLVVARDVTGQSMTYPLPAPEGEVAAGGGKPVAVPLKGIPSLRVGVTERSANAVPEFAPAIIPPAQRPRGQTAMEVMQLSMVEVEVRKGDWKQEKVYVPFSPYGEMGEPPEGKPPAVVDVPGVGPVALMLATTRRPLPSAVTLTKFEPVHFPGATRAYADYISTLTVVDKDGPDAGKPRTLVAQLNAPAADHGLYYFQSAWDGDDNAPAEKRFTVLGVANRPGIPLMTAGAILIIAGIGYAFYVKPILLRKKKEAVARWNAQRQTPPA